MHAVPYPAYMRFRLATAAVVPSMDEDQRSKGKMVQSKLDSAGRCLEVGDDKQNAQQQIRACKDQVRPVHASMQNQNRYRSSIAQFLKHRRNHKQPIAWRVRRYAEKRNLPRQSDAHESVKESRMSDRRRIFPPDEIEHEVERCDDQHTPNACDPKHDLRKSHGHLRMPASPGYPTERIILGESARSPVNRAAA